MKERQVYHLRIFFEGRVQGVGFRFRTLQIAREYEVSGQVCNLPDGRVELHAEGSQAEVEAFVEEVSDRMDVFIRKSRREGEFRLAQYAGFHIA
jgi:acylphosphatase